jgi:GTPase SAR1 family protein
MSGYSVLREQTLRLYEELLAISAEREASAATGRLTAGLERLNKDRLTIVVCGEFKRGKSSLLNALLDERSPLFPADARVTTSAVTVVSWGPEERIVVSLRTDGDQLEERLIARNEIARYATEPDSTIDHQSAVLITATTPNPLLHSGLSVVDTPGIGGVYHAHSAATMAFLPGADCIVFVVDFTQPLLRSELEFIRRATTAARMVGDIESLIFAITKADAVSGEEQRVLLGNATAKLAEATGLSPEVLNVLPVSSAAKLDYLEYGDPQDLADSNFVAFEEVLWSAVIRRRARVTLGTALSELHSTTGSLLQPLDDESAALQERTARRLTELNAEADQRNSAVTYLQGGHAKWHEELRNSMTQVKQQLADEADRQLDEVWHRCYDVYLQTNSDVDDPVALIERVTVDLNSVAGVVAQLAQQRAAVIQKKLNVGQGLQVRNAAIEALPPPSVPPVQLPVAPPRKAQRRFETGREFAEGMTLGSGLGAGIGGIIGTVIPVVGSAVGAFVGGAIGGLLGGTGAVLAAVERQAEADRTARRETIRTQLDRLRAIHRSDLMESLENLCSGLIDAAARELDSRIQQERDSVEDSLRRLALVKEATEQEAASRRRQIDTELAPLRRIEAEINRIATEAVRLGDRRAR